MSIWLLLIGLILGGVAVAVSYHFDGEPHGYLNAKFRKVGWAGFACGIVAIILVGSIAGAVGERWAKDNQLTYNEFLNGYETEAVHLVNTCTEDGSCHHTYSCDSYTITVMDTSTDSKGNVTVSSHTETRWRSCPYATEEHTYIIKTSLKKDYTIADNIFTADPQEWRGGEGLPTDVPRGDPAFWTAAAKRIADGNPGPVVVASTYKNYILASQNSILKQFSGAVDDYKKQNMLPQIASAAKNSGIDSPYIGTKVYFVKDMPNKDAWRAAVNQFDSAIGTDLQGDMHVVFVDKDTDKDRYKGALNAYWTGPELEKNDLSKNGIVLIIGTDGKTGSWVRAFTGMPGGNEGMLTQLESLKNIDLSNPSALLGTPKGVINGDKKVKEIVHSQGQIEQIVWGTNKFKRVCMTCEGNGDSGQGFTYLDAEIEPTGGQTATIMIVSGILFALIWAGIAWAQIPSPNVGAPKKKGA